MSTDVAQPDPQDLAVPDASSARSALEHFLATGDVSKLEPEQRVALYLEICRSLRINPRTRPFDWIEFWDPGTKAKKLVLYPTKTCTDQLAYLHRIRIEPIEERIVGTLYKVAVKGTMPDGRTEQNVAYLDLTDHQGQALRGQALANAYMKTHTKAKRRLVLGMVGMSLPDIEDIPRARTVVVDAGGNILERPTEEQRYLAEHPSVAAAVGEPTFEDHADAETGLEAEPETTPRQDPGPPARTGPRPSFKNDPETVKRWLGAWFAAVKGTTLDTDAARARYVMAWTSDQWPENKRTDSLRTMFARCTAAEAADFLALVSALCADEKKALIEDADAARARRFDADPGAEDAEPF